MNQWIIQKQVAARIPTRYGSFQLLLFRSNLDDKEQLAFIFGDVREKENVLVRVHSECFTGDVLGSLRCDCGEQLDRSLQLIANSGSGVLIYLRQEGRGIGLLDKLRAYNLQDEGFDTVEANIQLGHEADERDYTIAGLIIKDLGIHSVKMITNNPQKISELREFGIIVRERVPIEVPPRPENLAYLKTKVQRMDHLLRLSDRVQVLEDAA